MKTKTLAQVANDIENGNNLHEYYNNDGATIKAGNFESFGDFLSYYRQHYRPILEQVADGITPTGDNARLLRLLASDLLDIFKEDSDESEDKEEEDPTLTEAEKRDTLCRLWDAAWQQARQDLPRHRGDQRRRPDGTRQRVRALLHGGLLAGGRLVARHPC